ncbi:MAG TPA: glycosyltransferase family 2 protein [Atribacterota bacterium]|nr:glycosyltransferase family 2 protein [Atribacterota bacterium]
MKKEKLAILIPAYNEEPRIDSVLKVVCSYRDEKRIIVIDDGSSDRTAEQAQKYSVEVLRHNYNRGKGAALQTGIAQVGNADYWLFLDADLVSLKEAHLNALLRPLENNNNVGMTVGIFETGSKFGVNYWVSFAQKYFSILNGQMALSGGFIKMLPDLSWAKFGVEIFLTKLADYYGIKMANPILPGLTHHIKEDKLGLGAGFLYRLQMYRECLYALINWEKHL